METKLIILRGNAGSGKSTVAEILREKIDDEVVYLEQDIFRLKITKALKDENFDDRRNELTKGAIMAMLDWARENSKYIILDGIFGVKRYTDFFEVVKAKFKNVYAYYFDIPLEETIRRHQTREKAKLFGAEELASWYKPNNIMSTLNETIITKDLTKDEIVDRILMDIGLKQ